jgi:3-oxoacyl-[acyl-carrier protein] reductase
MTPGSPLVRRPALAAQCDGLITHYYDSTGTDRVAIVTGGSRGAGREVVRKLANRGYAVVVAHIRDQGAADSIVEEALAAGGTALTIRADVADELDVERMFAETAEAFGGVDVVVHAAGQVTPGPVADHDLDRFDAMLRASVRGTFLVNRQAARQLRDGGTIVNLAGSAVGLALPTDAASAASSAAVEAMTRVLACELRGRHITVNAVAPGLENPGDPAAIADIAAFLVSGDGRSLNGQVIHVDGGTE